MEKRLKKLLIPYSVLSLLVTAASVAVSIWVALAVFAASLAAFFVTVLLLRNEEKQLSSEMDDVLKHNTVATAKILNSVETPALIFNDKGRIVWHNPAFEAFGEKENLLRLLPNANVKHPSKATEIELAGAVYQAISIPIQRDVPDRPRLTFQYWLDRTEALHYKRLYEEQMPLVALIQIDNYEELMADQQFERNYVLTEVERRVNDLVNSIEGIYRQCGNARYLVVFEKKYLGELEKFRFSLLENVREINTGTSQAVTLSVGVGVASRIAEADQSAKQALEMALGRGGDQAVVKRGTAYSFYGGKRQVSTRQSKIKIRLFANAFRQILQEATDVYIMGHRQADMDCLGAAVGLMRCAKAAGCKGYIVLEDSIPSIKGALQEMRRMPEYAGAVILPEQAESMMRAGSVLIVVDTQRKTSMLAPHLIDRAGKVILIDHHRRSVDAFEGATLTHLEAGASSVCEMVTEILQYFEDIGKPTAFECDVLLAGMAVDTKQFRFNTTSRTFEAAAFLRRNGADTRMTTELYQDDMQMYRNRARVVQQAQMIADGVALAVCPKEMPNASLIAAQAADALISIRGINASFVLAHDVNYISVSGRSTGEINVQLILEKMGGGGHLTVAGAQLRGMDMDTAVQRVTEEVEKYLTEGQ